MADEIGFSFEDVMEKNLEKLKARYGDKFTKDKAINRDLMLQ
jgi:NTP pyrophosphatase (non-canonical NTP hydrolase)